MDWLHLGVFVTLAPLIVCLGHAAGPVPLDASGSPDDIRNRTQVGDFENTAALAGEELFRRKVIFILILVGGGGFVACLGVAAVYQKRGKLEITYIAVKSQDESASLLAPTPQAQDTSASGRPAPTENLELLLKQARAAQEKEKLARERWFFVRSLLLLLLFLLYVGTSIGIPMSRARHASCSHGFFWEDHLPFFVLFLFTKLMELALYVFDPLIQGDLPLTTFMMKFLPSFLGYIDGYTDSASIVIAHACDNGFAQMLSAWMAGTYLTGVVIFQWIVVAYFAFRDPSQACFMKLLHFDALSSCITLPEEAQRTWRIVNFARTFAEDIPQCIQQTLFLIYVRKNYFMLLSVVVGFLSSVKALSDAIYRTALAVGAHFDRDKTSDGRFKYKGGDDWVADFVKGEFKPVRSDSLGGEGVRVVSEVECVVPSWCGHSSTFTFFPDEDVWKERDHSNGTVSVWTRA